MKYTIWASTSKHHGEIEETAKSLKEAERKFNELKKVARTQLGSDKHDLVRVFLSNGKTTLRKEQAS